MDLRRLEYFVAAAEEQCFRRAAQRLRVNQPGFSTQIRQLEDSLGVELFQRIPGRRVKLTEVGRSFLIDARRIIDGIARAKEALQSVAFGKAGRLLIAVSEAVATTTLSRIFSAYRERYPHVQLEICELPALAQIRALQHHEIDLGLAPGPQSGAGVESEVIWSEEWRVALPKDHPLAERTVLAMGDLDGQPLITGHADFGPGCHTQVRELFRSAGVEPHLIMQAFHLSTPIQY